MGVLQLLTDSQYREHVERSATAFAETHLDKSTVYRELFELLGRQI
jgi:hypothetical protein